MQTYKQDPVIKKALGNEWKKLAPVVKRHYDLSPESQDCLTLVGIMNEVYHSPAAKLFVLAGRFFGALVSQQGVEIATVVRNLAQTREENMLMWHRTLHFNDKEPVVFESHMVTKNPHEVIEFVKFGMGIRMKLSVIDQALVYRSINYLWNIAGFSIPLPNWLLLGEAVIIESACADDKVHLDFKIRHPLLGTTFRYSGKFSISEGVCDG